MVKLKHTDVNKSLIRGRWICQSGQNTNRNEEWENHHVEDPSRRAKVNWAFLCSPPASPLPHLISNAHVLQQSLANCLPLCLSFHTLLLLPLSQSRSQFISPCVLFHFWIVCPFEYMAFTFPKMASEIHVAPRIVVHCCPLLSIVVNCCPLLSTTDIKGRL